MFTSVNTNCFPQSYQTKYLRRAPRKSNSCVAYLQVMTCFRSVLLLMSHLSCLINIII